MIWEGIGRGTGKAERNRPHSVLNCVQASSVLVDLRGSEAWRRGCQFCTLCCGLTRFFPPCSAPPPVEEVDNTVTLIILAVVGGVIGLLVCILMLKKLITFILKKTREKK